MRKGMIWICVCSLLMIMGMWGGCGTSTLQEKSGNDAGTQADTSKVADDASEPSQEKAPVEPATPDTAASDTTASDSTVKPDVATESGPTEPGPPDSTTLDTSVTTESAPEMAPETTADTQPLTCDDVKKSYNDTVGKTSCQQDADCQIIDGHCGVGLGGCYHATNSSVTKAELASLAQQWVQLKCGGGVCDCAEPPKAAVCNNNKCEPKKALTCNDIKTQYNSLTQAATQCTSDSDCTVLSGHCGVGLGGCWYLVNKSKLTQQQLDDLRKQWSDLNCSGPVCRCTAPPTNLQCSAGVCAQKP